MEARMNQETERRADRSNEGETLPPEVVKLLLVCGGEVRESDRLRVESMQPSEAADRRAEERRFNDRRHLERRFTERRHDERRAASG